MNLLPTIFVITWVQISHNAVSSEDISDRKYDMITNDVVTKEKKTETTENNNRVEAPRNTINESVLEEGGLFKRIKRNLVEHERYPLHPLSVYYRSTRRPNRNNKRNSKLDKLRFFGVFKAIKKLIPKLPKFSKKGKGKGKGQGKGKGKGKGQKKEVDINADVNVDSDDGSNDGEKQLLSIFKSYLSDSSKDKKRSNLSGTPIFLSKKNKQRKKKWSKGMKGKKPTKVTTKSPRRPLIDNFNLDFNVEVDLSNRKKSTNEPNESDKETLKKIIQKKINEKWPLVFLLTPKNNN